MNTFILYNLIGKTMKYNFIILNTKKIKQKNKYQHTNVVWNIFKFINFNDYFNSKKPFSTNLIRKLQ